MINQVNYLHCAYLGVDAQDVKSFKIGLYKELVKIFSKNEFKWFLSHMPI